MTDNTATRDTATRYTMTSHGMTSDGMSRDGMSRRKVLLTLAGGMSGVVLPHQVWAGARPPFGFILVGASWCAFCKNAAPILAALGERNGIPVLAASHDHRPIPPIRETVDGTKHPLSAGIVKFPTTLIYSTRNDAIIAQIEGYQGPIKYTRSLMSLLQQASRLRT